MWKAAFCAVTGRAHVMVGTPCQDKVCSALRNGVSAIALCDGAGSAKLSHYGAECTAQTVCDYLCAHFDDIYANSDANVVRKALLESILSALTALSQKMQCDIKELASTLLFVAVKNATFIAGHIGDGVLGYLKGDALLVASKPNNGEFVNTTMFTTSSGSASAMRLMKGILGEVHAFVIMSDGTETSFYNKRKGTLAPVLKRLMHLCAWREETVIEAMLQDALSGVMARATGDDMSIAFLVNTDKFPLFYELSKENKLAMLSIKRKIPNRCIKHYDDILSCLSQPMTLYKMQRKIHLKPSRAQKYADRLAQYGIISKIGDVYYI